MAKQSPANELRHRLAGISDDADRLLDNYDLAPLLADLLDWIAEYPDAAVRRVRRSLRPIDRRRR